MFRSALTLILLTFMFHPSSYAAEKGLLEFNKGVSFFKKKKYKSALLYFKKAHKKGMNKNTLRFNLAVTYYKLKKYNQAIKNFNILTKDKKFQQISFHNLGLIAEKRKKKKTAVQWYKKSVNSNTSLKITRLSNIQLNKLLNRKLVKKKKISTYLSLAFGNNDNITNAASNSPSNKSDTYLELFAFISVPINSKISFKGTLYDNSYSTLSTEDFSFYSAGLDYLVKTKNWRLTPEINLTRNTLNGIAYQNLVNYKLTAKRKFDANSSLSMRFRYSDINSKNTAYDYLKGDRLQFRVDYKRKIKLGKLRWRYQLETNNREDKLTKNYSPTRHTIRARLKHKVSNGWELSEDLAYRISTYESVAGVTREDTRLLLRLSASKKINKEWSAGMRYSHTNNNSNLASEDYSRNNIQIFSNWNF